MHRRIFQSARAFIALLAALSLILVSAPAARAASVPAVTAISPVSGRLAGGTVVTITGTNLSGATKVVFGTVTAAAFTNVSATQMTATAPAVGSAQTVDIKVTTGGGTSTAVTADKFTYQAAPTVTSISPLSGPLAGGTIVTITGTNLVGTTQVMFGTVAGTAVTNVSATQVKATAPSVGSAQSVDVTVTTTSGTSAVVAGDSYTYQPAPSVAGISPVSGPLAGGTVVTITGANLVGTTGVMFGTVAGTAVTNVSATQVKATAPLVSSAQAVDVKLTTTSGTSSVVAGDKYTYEAAPSVTSISPVSGPLAGGTEVTITGTNLVGTTQVMFGTVAGAAVTNVSATQVKATAPSVSSAQIVDLRVTTTSGTSAVVAGDKFTYQPTPGITSITPPSGPLGGGTVVTITGTNLTGTTQVMFGTVVGTAVTNVSATQVKATSPLVATTQTVDLQVVTTSGTSSQTAADQYTYQPAPTVTSISPAAGPMAAGTVVTITGTNLVGTTQVMFGTVAGTAVTNVSATQVRVTAPSVSSAQTIDVKVTTLSGTSAVVAGDQYSYQTAPTVTSINPVSGPLAGGTVVTITGTNLTNTSQVMFGTVAGTAVTNISATQVKATAPAVSSAQAVDIQVITPGGSSAVVNGDRFTYQAAPAITSITPVSGPLAGGTVVTITGSNLVGTTQVMFGTVAGTAVTNVSATQVKATAPSVSTAQTVDIQVTTTSGASAPVPADLYTYQAGPIVISISPVSGPLAGGTVVTITGTALTGTTAVMFGTAAGTTVTNVSATQVKATAPSVSSAQSVDIKVTTTSGTSTTVTADKYTYQAAPTVTAITPTSGPLTGGTVVTITGTNLTGTTGVMFGSVAGTVVTNVSATQVKATAPSVSTPQTVDVNVTTTSGTSTAVTADNYTYIAAPTVTSIIPVSGPLAGGTVVTITGTSLTGTTQVMFGSVAGTAVTNVSATQVKATAPAVSTAQVVDIRIITVGGTSDIATGDLYTYQAAPTVTSISPVSGPLAGGTVVTITGANLTGTTQIMFGTVAGTAVTTVSATQVRVTAPSVSTAQTVDVKVTTTSGTSAVVVGDSYTYQAAPTVTAISPASGPLTAGTVVTITGTNLTGTTGVTFGTVAGTAVTNVSATQVEVTAPAVASAQVIDVRVTTTSGTSAVVTEDKFTYQATPAITALSPASGPVAGGTVVTITGTNLTGTMQVLFGSAAGTAITVVSDEEVKVTSPIGTVGPTVVSVATPGGTASSTSLYVFLSAVTATPDGAPVTVISTVGGQDAFASFGGVSGQRLAFQLSSVTYGSGTYPATLSILNPDGTTLVPATGFNDTGLFVDTTILPTSGSYTILVHPQATVTGQATIGIVTVPSDIVSVTTPGTDPLSIDTVPGQNAIIRMTATKDQPVTFEFSGVTYGTGPSAAQVTIYNPDGSTLVPVTGFNNDGLFIDTRTLSASGIYTITIDPQGAGAGHVQLDIHDVSDLIVPATIDGGTVTVSTVKQQNARVTFTGSANQRLAVTLTGGTYSTTASAVKVSVARPDATTLVQPIDLLGATAFIPPFTLDATGTYTLLIDPPAVTSGSVQVSVYAEQEPVHANLTVDGDYVALTTTVPSQKGEITADLAAGVTYRLRIDGQYEHSLTLASPDGSLLTFATTDWVTATDCIRTFAATETGAHTLTLAPTGAVIGTWRLELYTNIGIPRISGPTDTTTWTDDKSPLVSWTVDTAPGVAVQYNSAVDQDPNGKPSGDYRFDYPATWLELIVGDNWVHVTAYPSVGQPKTGNYKISFDGPPVMGYITSTSHPVEGALSADPALSVSWMATDRASGIAGYSVSFTAGTGDMPDETVDTTSESWTGTATSDGLWTLTVRAVDAAGNWGTATSYSIRVSAAGMPAPTLASATHPDQTLPNSARTFVGTWSLPEGQPNPETWAYSVTSTIDDVPNLQTLDRTVSQQLEPGTWYLNVKALDSLGRWSPTAHRTVLVGATPGIISPVPNQLIWGTETVLFSCGDEIDTVQVNGPTSATLPGARTATAGVCAASWDTDLTINSQRSYPAGSYSISLTGGGSSSEPISVTLAEDPTVIDAISNYQAVGIFTSYQAAVQAERVIYPSATGALDERIASLTVPAALEDALSLFNRIEPLLTPAEKSTLYADAIGAGSSLRSPTAADGRRGPTPTAPTQPACSDNPHVGRSCVYSTEHFQLSYRPLDWTTSPTEGDLPTLITHQGDAFESAWTTYQAMGFDVPSLTPVVYLRYGTAGGVPTEQGFTPGFMPMTIYANSAWIEGSLAQHEFFHMVEWQYISSIPPDQDKWWFQESAAEWAAGHAAHAITDNPLSGDPQSIYGDELTEYAGKLPAFLRNTDAAYDALPELGSSEYGAFVLHYYLEFRFGIDPVLLTLKMMRKKGISASSAIESWVGLWGTPLAAVLYDFRWSTYLLDDQYGYGFPVAYVNQWRGRIVSALDEGRLPAEKIDVDTGGIISGTARVHATGSQFIEFSAKNGLASRLVIDLGEVPDGMRVGYALAQRVSIGATGKYRIQLCSEPLSIDPGQRTISANVDAQCPILAVNVYLQSLGWACPAPSTCWADRVASLAWSARVSSVTATYGAIKARINEYGGLMDEAINRQVAAEATGLQNTTITDPTGSSDSFSEVLAAGCGCEGWGIGNADLSGSYTAFDGARNLENPVLDVETNGDVVSQVRLGDLTISHRFTESGDSRLMKVEVTVLNTGQAAISGLHYRRVFDWDPNPTRFYQNVTFAKLSSLADNYVSYVSDDGFANPDPSATPTYIATQGYFSQEGPDDRGGQIDVRLGDLAPGQSVSFMAYYGVTRDTASAVQAVEAVDAQVYSLGQAAPYQEQPDPGFVTVTGVFAIDGRGLDQGPAPVLDGEYAYPINQYCLSIAC